MKVINILWSYDELKFIYSAVLYRYNITHFSGRLKVAYILFYFADKLKLLSMARRYYLKHSFRSAVPAVDVVDATAIFDQFRLSFHVSRIYDLPNFEINSISKSYVSVLCPAFDLDTISAGFFGVFAFAKFSALNGLPTKIILTDYFDFDISRFRTALSRTPGLEDLLDLVEVEYCGDRSKVILIHPDDIFVATVWYTAYIANKAQSLTNKRKFIYLIQDYECNFLPHDSSWLHARKSYDFAYVPWFSTKFLLNFFKENGLINQDAKQFVDFCIYNNPATIDAGHRRIARHDNVRNFVFYSRMEVNRNMFFLGSYVICEAVKRGYFTSSIYSWKFYGMGLGKVIIRLGPDLDLVQLPRMSLKTYYEKLYEFDLGLTLMASPHPSLIPFDLAAIGCRVVTNNYFGKDQSSFLEYSNLISSAEPDLECLLSELKKNIEEIEKGVEKTYYFNYPRSWAETWTEEHKQFLKKLKL